MITWVIEGMKTTPTTATPPDFVIECGWRCNGEDGGFGGTVYGSCSFTQGAEEDGSFTPYADLTQDQVLGWCWANGVDKDATEANVVGQIEAQKNPPVIQPPLPWAA